MSTRQDKFVHPWAAKPAGQGGEPAYDARFAAILEGVEAGKLPEGTDLSFADRLQFALLLLWKGRSDQEVEALLGRSAKQIRRYVGGEDMPLSVFLKIAEHSGVPVQWIAGERFSTGLAMAKPEQPASGFVFVPRLEVAAAAGAGRLSAMEGLESGEVIAFREDWMRRIGVSPRHAQALFAWGDSMEPTIRDGDLILIDRSITQVIDNGIYVVVFGGLVFVKRIHMRRDGSVALRSDNELLHDDEIVPAHDLESLIVEGRVRWIGRTI